MGERHVYQKTLLRRVLPIMDSIHLERYGGLGDELFVTRLAYELKREFPRKRIVVHCSCPAIFENLSFIDRVTTERPNMWGSFYVDYQPYISKNRLDPRHISVLLADVFKISVSSTLPIIQLTDAERERVADYKKRFGTLVTVSTRTSSWTANKLWFDDGWAEVCADLSGVASVVHLGGKDEPILDGVERFAGKTGVREAMLLLAASDVYLGPVSFLMHAAAALGTPQVIVYGGFEKPTTSAYASTIPLTGAVSCSPCWLTTACPNNRECMSQIAASHVVTTVKNVLEKSPLPSKVVAVSGEAA